MANLKFVIHPLFFIFGLYFAFIGKVFSFLVFTLVALIHEFGHYIASSKLGYKLNRIVLMPYGAIISGDTDFLRYKDECKIALAGPLINFLIAIFFVALWWFIPTIYSYTDIIVVASLSIAIINLLPCYPLDGGRFLCATLSLLVNRKTALKIVRVIGIIVSIVFFALFIYSLFVKPNFTVLFFALFMFVGAIDKNKKNCYIKTAYAFLDENYKKPKIVKKIALSSECLVKDIYPFIDGNFYCEILILNERRKAIYTLSGNELQNTLVNSDIYKKLKDLRTPA